MKNIFILVLLAIFFYSCENKKTENQSESDTTSVGSAPEVKEPTLTKVWETDTVMTTAESTLYDKGSNTIYVSNIQGNHSVKDKKGFIAKMSPDGSVTQLNWVSGLNAPKGMAIMNQKLYVTDIDELVEIDIANAKVLKKYPVQGAKFLNDAASDGNKVFFSDSNTGKVHVLDNGKVTTLTDGMEGINGLQVNDKDELFILDGKGLRKYNMESKESEFINEVVTGGDGLVIIDENTYIASRWKGEIYLIKDGKEHLMLDTTPEESNTADIDYIADQKLVLVPTFMKNKVVAYKLDY